MNPENNQSSTLTQEPKEQSLSKDEGLPPVPMSINFDNYLNLWFKFNVAEHVIGILLADKGWSEEVLTEHLQKAKETSFFKVQAMFPQYKLTFSPTPTNSKKPLSEPVADECNVPASATEALATAP